MFRTIFSKRRLSFFVIGGNIPHRILKTCTLQLPLIPTTKNSPPLFDFDFELRLKTPSTLRLLATTPISPDRVRLRGGVRVATGVVGGLPRFGDDGDAENAERIDAHRVLSLGAIDEQPLATETRPPPIAPRRMGFTADQSCLKSAFQFTFSFICLFLSVWVYDFGLGFSRKERKARKGGKGEES